MSKKLALEWTYSDGPNGTEVYPIPDIAPYLSLDNKINDHYYDDLRDRIIMLLEEGCLPIAPGDTLKIIEVD